MKKTPLQRVKELYGSKEALVGKLSELLDPADGESREELAARLKHVANNKLLHLHDMAAKVKEIGGKEALVNKVAELRAQAKDADFVKKLGGWSSGKLLDAYESLSRTARKSGAAAGE